MKLLTQRSSFETYKQFGAHLEERVGVQGVRFTVWAPRASEVRVIGCFNHWQGNAHQMKRDVDTGVWSLFIPDISEDTLYKYEIWTADGRVFEKADPYAIYSELRPGTASIVRSLNRFFWSDEAWMERRKTSSSPIQQPILIYEVHLGTWRRKPNGDWYTYRELAHSLVDYVVEMGFTHIELLPVMEHPFDRSWGYQVTGFFAATSRYGSPEDLMYFINYCHEREIGVILDWVPGHFCKDAHGLLEFDGEPLYEYADPRWAEKPVWGTRSFDFSRPEVVQFLVANALFWFDVYHVDGLRVDAVASMIDLNLGRPMHELIFNEDGQSENKDAVRFLQTLNTEVKRKYPDVLMMAEDSSARPGVTAPVQAGGLGFDLKWNMGWMNDTLRYMDKDPIYRKHHHNELTFSLMYAFSEKFLLPFSHDEVSTGDKSMLGKMPGDRWQQFANLRLLYGYMNTHPGKKLLFMGSEFAQDAEWKDLWQLDWGLLELDVHRQMQQYVQALNHLTRSTPALWQLDDAPAGFTWIEADDHDRSILIYLRSAATKDAHFLLILCNFTPMVHTHFKVGVPQGGLYQEVFNSDDVKFGGSGQTNNGMLTAKRGLCHQQPYYLELTMPPLACTMLAWTVKSNNESNL